MTTYSEIIGGVLTPPAADPKDTSYAVVDLHTSRLVSVIRGGRRARARAEKLNLAYGAHRYTARWATKQEENNFCVPS